MSLVVHDPDVVGDVDPEGEARDQVLIEEMLNEWTDEPQFRHDVYPESDGEDNADGPERVHTHIRRGDRHLYPKQTFFSGVAIKEAVVDYALRTGCNLKQYRYDQDKIGFKCVGNDGKEEGVRCEWQVYAASLPNDPMWKIRKFIDKHSCIPNGECEMFKVLHIARLFVDKIRENLEFYMPAKIEELIKEQWKISVTRNQCQAARKKARQWIEKEYDDQFARLRDYAAEILESNPDSHVEVDCLNEEGKDMFNRFYVCFDSLRKTWKDSCRPLLGIDGCFLKNKVKGQLLVALGRDANNKIYPVAWGVVKVENTENWVWFVKNLKEDLGLGDGEGFIMLSDRQKGLIKAVSLELPSIEHRMCVQHIYGNLKKNHGSKTRMKPLLWNLAWAYNEKDYKQHLEKIFYYDTVVFNDIMKTNPMSWCRAFQRRGNYCEDVDNNFTESFNGSLNKAREKPFVAMLETIRRLAMVRIAKRSVESHTHTGSCTPYVALVLSAEHKFASLAKVSTSTNGMYEVRHGLDSQRVCLKSYTCTCQKWQIRGIPCEHAYGVILDKKLAPEDYVCHWFRTSTWKKNYTDGLCPQRGPKFWPETQLPAVFNPQPPEGEKNMTKEDKKRKKGVNESPTKKASKNKKRIMHCGICGTADHNSRGCQKKAKASQSVLQPSQPEP
ncbi:Zinc finger SWIM-type [Arabidopsis thaliana x Arabidopsis arenosa]|uniref:Zinc finger SWIM-type n=1 Tax=Arabidopsis thaliana x Arabidopsis arenosa TaxID=1240361 RepID=A0A8T2C1E6_9BRAS|nr:Zinc finger SWIM-type [Arabidopsis thaliana x Arabidopsis arenosa]